MSSFLTAFLPQSEGLLPKWLLFVRPLSLSKKPPHQKFTLTYDKNKTKIAIISLGNTIQCYRSLTGSQEVYSGSSPKNTTTTSPKNNPSTSSSPVTPLSARTFGTWTALSSIIRLYGAYNIHDAKIYELCLWTYGIAFGHFLSEWWIFGTARWGRGLAGPVLVSTVTSLWMLVQWGSYVR